MRDKMKKTKQAGAVSIFVVIFATLLMSVITVGFVRLMVGEQQKAFDSNLSQSAYDSAMTGVEDAKRAILRYQNQCNANIDACPTYASQLTTSTCNSGIIQGNPASPGEQMIEQGVGDDAIDQAYTCVTVDLTPGDYTGKIKEKNASVFIPLKGVSTFDRVAIEWFNSDDTSGANANIPAVVSTGGQAQPFVEEGAWPENRPPVLRTSLMQFGDNFTLGEFDAMTGGQSNVNTLFLHPTNTAAELPGTANAITGYDQRNGDAETGLIDKAPRGVDSPYRAPCKTSLGASDSSYACKVTLELPTPVGGGDRTAYLRLTALYATTNFRLTLYSGSTEVKFKDTQAAVDSTGRANDLFRRVQSRVNLVDTSFPYPAAAVDLGGSLCKNFSVDDEGYQSGGTECNP